MEPPKHSLIKPIPREYEAKRCLADKERTLFGECIHITRSQINSLARSRTTTLQASEKKEILNGLISRCQNIIENDQTQLAPLYEEFILQLKQLDSEQNVSFSCFSKKIIHLANAHFSNAIDVHILGVKVIGDFSIFPEDRKRSKLANSFAQCQMDCTLFTFYHLNDQYLVRSMIEDRDDEAEACQQYKQTHYKGIKKPRAGDVIAYGNLTPSGFIPLHAGILLQNGHALSMWGEGGTVMEHGIAEVPLSYGNYIQFSRKKKRFKATMDLIKQIDEAKEGLKSATRSHPLCYSPLTCEGTRAVFLQIAARCFKEQQETAFVRSFFGVRVLEPLYKNITKAVAALKISEETGREDLLKELRSLVKKESFNLPVDFTLEGAIKSGS